MSQDNIYTANIGNITRLRINEDGPGVRSVIFMCACPLNCVWCCNPVLCLSKRYKTLSADELYTYLAKDILYFKNSGGGITFSGGEPLLYPDFIHEFITKYCKDFSAEIETSLYTAKENLEKLVPLINHWYIDFKVFDEKKHLEYTGVSNETIKANLQYLSSHIDTNKITVTYPVIPGYNTSEENLSRMMGFLKDLDIQTVELHPYRKKQEKKHFDLGLQATVIEELTKTQYEKIKETFLQNGFLIPAGNPYREKEKCRYLKAIRKKLCEDEKIPLTIKDCDFEGRCVGTCPQCEYELTFINDWQSKNNEKSDNT